MIPKGKTLNMQWRSWL